MLRAYAVALLDKENERHAAAARHAAYYRAFAKNRDWRAIEHAFDQIEHGWQWVQANTPEQIIDYVFAVWRLLDTRGRKVEALDWFQRGLTQARAANDRKNEGTLLNNIGSVYDDLGQKDKALDFYGQALVIQREVGNRFGESVTLFNIGLLLDETGRTAEAVSYLEQCVTL